MKGIAFIVLLIAAMFFMSSHTTAATDECTTADAVFAIGATGNITYNVTTFTVTVGSCLEIRLEDLGDISHSFTLLAANGSEWTRLFVSSFGQVDSVKLQMPATPTDFTFYCDQPGHRANGMEGRIYVVLDTITSDCSIFDIQFNLAITSTGFNNTKFEANQGDCLKIHYINEDTVNHNLLILNSTKSIVGYISALDPAGQASTIILIPNIETTYTFISSPPTSPQVGSEGMIVSRPGIDIEECPTADAYLRMETHTNGNYQFNQTSITVAQGSCLSLSLINKGDVEVDFIVEMPNAKIEGKLQQDQTLEYRLLMPNQDITIDYYDNTPGHRASGEFGTIIVGQGSPTTNDGSAASSKPGITLPAFEAIVAIMALMSMLPIRYLRKRL